MAEHDPDAVTPEIETLFAKHYVSMVRLAALLGAADPEDVAQEAFVRFDRRKGDPLDASKSLAYLRTTVTNLCRSRLRHLRVARRVRHIERPVESAETLALLNDDRRRVIEALAKLTDRQRQVLVLRYWSQLPERQVAELLDISIGTVKSTTAKSLSALGKILGDER